MFSKLKNHVIINSMKKIITLLLFLCLTLPLFGFTLKGGVTYTVEQARKEAFANVEYTIPKHIIDANRTDPNYKANKTLIKNGIKETGDRYITYFSDGGYGIVYKNNLYYEFYYKENGKIDHIGKRYGLKFPAKKAKFDKQGNLIRIVFAYSANETFIFFPNGQLDTYWHDNVEYDLKGNVLNKRF